MKRHGNLFREIISMENLIDAAYRASAGKRKRENVIAFNRDLIDTISALRRELSDGTYRPGVYREFFIYDGKKRKISAAPFRDRVVHHALCNVIMPLFERTFIDTTFANRKGKGAHRAVSLCWRYLRSNRYYLKCDIKKYFPSIDHAVLKDQIRSKIKCPGTLDLADRIIDGSNAQEPVLRYFPNDCLFTPCERRRGLPLGNLTSQYFANIYLTPFDHRITKGPGAVSYIRYVDDFVLFHDDKRVLLEYKKRIMGFLETLRLTIHENRAQVTHSRTGITFLGWRIFRTHVRLKRDSVIRARRNVKILIRKRTDGVISEQSFKSSVFAWYGHAKNGDTRSLCREVLRGIIAL